MNKLDTKDRKLLYYLSLDARQSHTQLARLVGLSKNGVKYRIEKLKQEGVIEKFAAVVNHGALGMNTFTILARFNEDIYDKPDIIEYFRKHKYADWVITLSGQWDIFAELTTKDLMAMQDILTQMTAHFGKTLSNYKVFLSNDTLRVEHLIEDFYKNVELKPIETPSRQFKEQELDEVDRKLLQELNKDSTAQYLDLAKRTGTTADIVRYRMRNLTKNGILIKCFPEVSLSSAGYSEYLFIIKLRNASNEEIDRLKSRIKIDGHTKYAFFDVMGNNIAFHCAFMEPEETDRLSRELRKEFSGIIDTQEYHLVKEQVLFNLFPDGLAENQQ